MRAPEPSALPLALPRWGAPDFAAELRERGFEVRTVAGTGHCAHRVHRDNLNGFLSTLAGWI